MQNLYYYRDKLFKILATSSSYGGPAPSGCYLLPYVLRHRALAPCYSHPPLTHATPAFSIPFCLALAGGAACTTTGRAGQGGLGLGQDDWLS
eukprot:scaffold306690_cov35-Tisochrysis_lutea.AAC.1